MVISETPIESHAVHRDRLIEHARRMLLDGDRLQACEKIWGAAAHGLKVVADRRGWPYTLHSDGRVIASYLGKLTGSKDLPGCSATWRGCTGVSTRTRSRCRRPRSGCRTRTSFLRLLEAADRSVPEDAPAPDDPQYIRRHARQAQG